MDGLLDETSDLEQLPAFGGDESNEDSDDHQKRRQICWDGCGRPSSVCLCPHLPLSPIPTSTRVVVLHHPHELRSNPRATVPVLSRCLRHVTTISGRRLRLGSSPLLDSLHHHQNTPHPTAAALLFPGPGSVDLSRWAAAAVRSGARPVLIAIDGTWGQAREMAAASLPFLSGFAARVALGGEDEAAEGPSTCESDLVLRKEPYKGCVSTMEAVARALRVIEPDGEAVEERLLSVLRAMVGFQARNLRPTRPRPRMKKKKKGGERCLGVG